MHNASSRYQPQILTLPESKVEVIPTLSVKPRRLFGLRGLLEAFAFLSEARTMPFNGVGAAAPRDERSRPDR
jgi:hypothetical protein